MNASGIIDQDYRLGTTAMPEPYMVVVPNPGMYIELFHGRTEPSEDMDDWGEPGPIFGPLRFVQGTYACNLKFDFLDGDGGWLVYVDDCIYYDGKYYGDFSVFNTGGGNGVDLEERYCAFRKELAIPPTRETDKEKTGSNVWLEIREVYPDGENFQTESSMGVFLCVSDANIPDGLIDVCTKTTEMEIEIRDYVSEWQEKAKKSGFEIIIPDLDKLYEME